MIGFEDKSRRRRKHQRMPIVVLCDVSAPDTGRILGRGIVLNYSRGGLSIASAAELAFDSEVNLTVDGLDQEGFLAAKVANSRPVIEGFRAYGLEFIGLNPLQRGQLERRFKKLVQALLT